MKTITLGLLVMLLGESGSTIATEVKYRRSDQTAPERQRQIGYSAGDT